MSICGSQESGFLVLNKKSAWEEGLPVHLQVSDAGIQLEEILEYAAERTVELKDVLEGLEVTDFCVGQCDWLYILDAKSRTIWVYDVKQAKFEKIDCINAWFAQPTSLAFIPGTLYVADEKAEGRILALAQINWQIRWLVSAAQDSTGKPLGLKNPLAPIALAVDEHGTLYALDHLNLALVKFDRAGRLVDVFGHDALKDKKPMAIALSQEEFLYVLDQKDKKVLQFSKQGTLANGSFIDLQKPDLAQKLPDGFEPSGLAVDAQGQLYVGDRRADKQGEEDSRFIHKFSPTGRYIGVVPGYRGSVQKLVVDNQARIYIFDGKEKIIVLKPARKFLRSGVAPPPKGVYYSKALDSATSGTQWHKLVFDAEIPENTQILVSYLVSDDKKFPLNGAKKDLDTFLIGTKASVDDVNLTRVNGLDWSVPLLNPQDALIRGPSGRYLWLRVELIGSEQSTPTVHSLRAYFPRTSYLRYLPAVYQEEDRNHGDFLERFLALFETFFAGLEWQIDHVVRFFDADVASGDFLHWLAAWLAIAVDDNWTEKKLRVLVKRAPELYKKRGTREGIAALIEIFTGNKPIIVEQFQLQCVKDALEEADLRLRAPVCGCAQTLDRVLRFERILPTPVFRGEDVEVTLILKPLQDMGTIAIESIKHTGAKLTLTLKPQQVVSKIEIEESLQGDLHFSAQQPGPSPSIVARGEKLVQRYHLRAGKQGGTIHADVKIWNLGATTPVLFKTHAAAVAVRQTFKELLVRLYGDDPYCFCVLLKPFEPRTDGGHASLRRITEGEQMTVRRIVELEKPAHTCAGVKTLQPWLYLDMHTYLGINTYLSQPSASLDVGSAMPRDTVLTDVSEVGQIERRSRLDIDTTIT